jgi:hypothetical protein
MSADDRRPETAADAYGATPIGDFDAPSYDARYEAEMTEGGGDEAAIADDAGGAGDAGDDSATGDAAEDASPD